MKGTVKTSVSGVVREVPSVQPPFVGSPALVGRKFPRTPRSISMGPDHTSVSLEGGSPFVPSRQHPLPRVCKSGEALHHLSDCRRGIGHRVTDSLQHQLLFPVRYAHVCGEELRETLAWQPRLFAAERDARRVVSVCGINRSREEVVNGGKTCIFPRCRAGPSFSNGNRRSLGRTSSAVLWRASGKSRIGSSRLHGRELPSQFSPTSFRTCFVVADREMHRSPPLLGRTCFSCATHRAWRTSGRRQGHPCRPPTPPDVRIRIRRFMK
jgi:hypothetical protein